MKIAIDSWVLASRFRHQGTYVYARSMIAEFKNLVPSRPDIQFCLFTSPRNSSDAGRITPTKRFELAPAPLLSHDRLWRLGGVSRAAANARADVIFAPTASGFPLGGIPVACTIHDVTPVVMPAHSMKVTLLQRSCLWWTARRAQAIITDSQCSKNDLLNLYNLPESRVEVVYLGYDKALFNDVGVDPELQRKLLAKLRIDRSYILHHGVIQPRKNLKRLIQAYRLMLSRNPNLNLKLVLAGSLGWNYEEILQEINHGVADNSSVVMAGALDGPDLAMLVKGATLTVIPSLYEGFCLPMVEAMACGVPVIAANSSCLPEISGGVLQYFDPCSIEQMASCMEQVLEDRQLRARLAQEGKRRAQCFNWQRCAQETLTVLTQVLANDRQ